MSHKWICWFIMSIFIVLPTNHWLSNGWTLEHQNMAKKYILEDDVVIAGNSFVNRSVPKGAIVAGCPAKIIGWRKNLDYAIETNPKYKDGRMPFLTK